MVFAGSAFVPRQHVPTYIRNHRTGLRDHRLGFRNHHVSIDCQLGLKGNCWVWECITELTERTLNT